MMNVSLTLFVVLATLVCNRIPKMKVKHANPCMNAKLDCTARIQHLFAWYWSVIYSTLGCAPLPTSLACNTDDDCKRFGESLSFNCWTETNHLWVQHSVSMRFTWIQDLPGCRYRSSPAVWIFETGYLSPHNHTLLSCHRSCLNAKSWMNVFV
jgi:hypothetical protein